MMGGELGRGWDRRGRVSAYVRQRSCAVVAWGADERGHERSDASPRSPIRHAYTRGGAACSHIDPEPFILPQRPPSVQTFVLVIPVTVAMARLPAAALALAALLALAAPAPSDGLRFLAVPMFSSPSHLNIMWAITAELASSGHEVMVRSGRVSVRSGLVSGRRAAGWACRSFGVARSPARRDTHDLHTHSQMLVAESDGPRAATLARRDKERIGNAFAVRAYHNVVPDEYLRSFVRAPSLDKPFETLTVWVRQSDALLSDDPLMAEVWVRRWL